MPANPTIGHLSYLQPLLHRPIISLLRTSGEAGAARLVGSSSHGEINGSKMVLRVEGLHFEPEEDFYERSNMTLSMFVRELDPFT